MTKETKLTKIEKINLSPERFICAGEPSTEELAVKINELVEAYNERN